ncbi:MAG: ABC transporter permease [Pirellulaceae bacterium]
MWAYSIRRLLYNVPVFLGILLFVMGALRVNDPIYGFLGKNASEEEYKAFQEKAGLDKPFWLQYAIFVKGVITFDFSTESWDQPGLSVGERLRRAIGPSLSITIPALILSTAVSVVVGLVSAYFRGQGLDRTLVFIAVLGMSISFLVYIILGQYFGAYVPNRYFNREVFSIHGYDGWSQLNLPVDWAYYCLLPVVISVVVSMGYDTRYYRAVMVEETGRDYMITAQAKGASKPKVMFVHMLKNAMIPIITRVAITLPFLITGSILLETYFGIPGMGQTLISAVNAKDFPVVQAFTAVFAALYILTNILTDVLYALVDPRIRLA